MDLSERVEEVKILLVGSRRRGILRAIKERQTNQYHSETRTPVKDLVGYGRFIKADC